jgi:ABC-type dipeptide/oligopeptide/nickel transport system permease subunit
MDGPFPTSQAVRSDRDDRSADRPGDNLLTSTFLPEANQIDLRFRYAPPWPLADSSPEHLLGTDRLGRDLLSRMLVGTQNSLSVALLAITFVMTVGTFLGLVSGYLGGLR